MWILLIGTALAASVFDDLPARTWTKITPTVKDSTGADISAVGFPIGDFSGLVYDSDRAALLLFGGGGHGGRRGNDVWRYDVASNTWSQDYAADPEENYPYWEDDVGATFDEYCNSSDIYTCNPSSDWLPWGSTSTGRPWTSHSYDQMAYDSATHRLVFYGANFIFGYDTAHYYGSSTAWAYDPDTKTWEAYDSRPDLYHQTGMAEYDPVERTVIAVNSGPWTHPGWSWVRWTSNWALDVDTGEWSERAVPPLGWADTNLVYDTVGRQMLVYGSDFKTSPAEDRFWSYKTATDTWTELFPTPDPVYGSPPAAAPHAAFDSTNGVMLMLGECDQDYLPTWAYHSAENEWERLADVAEPTGTVYCGANLAYDPTHNVFLLVASSGHWQTMGGVYSQVGELWAFRYEGGTGTGDPASDTLAPAAPSHLRSL